MNEKFNSDTTIYFCTCTTTTLLTIYFCKIVVFFITFWKWAIISLFCPWFGPNSTELILFSKRKQKKKSFWDFISSKKWDVCLTMYICILCECLPMQERPGFSSIFRKKYYTIKSLCTKYSSRVFHIRLCQNHIKNI